MIQLPNGAKCSELSVFPKNWNTRDADLSLTWYIKYRYYPKDGKPKQVVVKGFGEYKTLQDRREAVRDGLAWELGQLREGMNPITRTPAAAESNKLIDCLRQAEKVKKCGARSREELRQVIPWIEKAVKRLGLNIPASSVSRKHIRMILDELPKIKSGWSNNQFNHYRKNLSILFEEMIELELVESNPVKLIRKMAAEKKLRVVLTDAQRIEVDQFLRANYPSFRRFVIIFFYSGSRISELLRLRKQDVDINRQTFRLWIIKGQDRKQVEKSIHNSVVDLWLELLSMPGEYLFGKGLIPGESPINPAQVSRRWRNHIKDKEKLGIEVDFYSLKHLYLDSISGVLNLRAASLAADHTSTSTTEIYTINERERKHQMLKTVPVMFTNN